MKPLVDDGLGGVATWPGSHRAAGWVRLDGTRRTTGDAERVHPLASVTKLLTTMGVLVAVQEEIVHLDEAAGPPGSTVRHLLSHASGLPFDGDVPIAAPGQRRIYGNRAFELLPSLVAERAEVPFADYLQEGVLSPLEMVDTTLTGSPAHGGRSTLADLLSLALELLRPGRVLADELLAEATTPYLPDLEGVLPGFGRQSPNPWGVGFEVRGHKTPHWTPAEASPQTFGHFGGSGAFVWVDPVADVACVGLADRLFGNWAMEAWPAVGSAVLTAAAR